MKALQRAACKGLRKEWLNYSHLTIRLACWTIRRGGHGRGMEGVNCGLTAWHNGTIDGRELGAMGSYGKDEPRYTVTQRGTP